jgi:glycosyltransferase involved in cell wall biosynthesis
MMIKVAIDSGPLSGGDAVRGIGFHTKLLLNYLNNIEGLKVDALDVRKENVARYDLIHYQKFHPYFLSIPFFKKGKSVLTIHDLIYFIYPKAYPSGIRGRVIYWLQKILIKKMDAIITISETSKKDIVRLLSIPAEKIYVIYLAPGEMFKRVDEEKKRLIKKKYNLPDKFVLYLGDVNYNKNLLTLCRAVKMVGIPLVIVGKQAAEKDFDRGHPETQPLARLLKEYGDDKSIIRLGFIPDEDLVGVFNLATLYSQPSFYEGFCLPILQAFACGTPVIASKIQTHVEVDGNACLYADPKDPADFASKIKLLLKDAKLRQELIAKGSQKVKEYSWDRVAKETADVYKKVLTL